METSPENIRLQMEDTRHSLQDKLETLEQQVKDTVSEATDTVSTVKETVEAVKDTMQETTTAVRETVHDTVDAVKDTVHDTVESVRESIDLRRQMQAHPWAMLAGAVAVGYLGGKLVFAMMPPPARPSLPAAAPLPPAENDHAARKAHHRGNGHGGRKAAKSEEAETGILGGLAQHFSKELNLLKSMAVGAAGNMLREALTSSAPESLVQPIKDVVDGITQKLGGKPMEGSILGSVAGPDSR
jgi:hypothetical protein